MTGQNSADRAARLLTTLNTNDFVRDTLAGVPYDFVLDRAEYAEDWELALASGDPHVGLASTGSGRAFFLCGSADNGTRRPVVHYDAASSTMAIGHDLVEAMELVVGLPYLMDILSKLSVWGRDAAIARHHESLADINWDLAEDAPEFPEEQRRLAAELGIHLRTPEELIDRLRVTATELTPELTFVYTPENKALEHRLPKA